MYDMYKNNLKLCLQCTDINFVVVKLFKKYFYVFGIEL